MIEHQYGWHQHKAMFSRWKVTFSVILRGAIFDWQIDRVRFFVHFVLFENYRKFYHLQTPIILKSSLFSELLKLIIWLSLFLSPSFLFFDYYWWWKRPRSHLCHMLTKWRLLHSQGNNPAVFKSFLLMIIKQSKNTKSSRFLLYTIDLFKCLSIVWYLMIAKILHKRFQSVFIKYLKTSHDKSHFVYSTLIITRILRRK